MQNCTISKRKIGLDFAKYICSFMVICIHMTYPGKAYIEPLMRFAVPLFFMITGFFYSSIRNKGKALVQIRKNITLFVFANLLYLVWNILKRMITGQSLVDYWYSFRSLSLWIRFLFFNGSLLSEHLWYIGALVYILIIVFVLDKYCGRRCLYRAIPILLLLNVVLGNYSTVIFGFRFPLVCSRNFLLMGLPFFLLGDYLHQEQKNWENWHLQTIAVISIFGTVLENIFLINTGLPFNTDCFISTPFLACSLFLLALKNEDLLTNHFCSAVASLGKNTSTTIYIIHPILIFVIGKVMRAVGESVAIVPTLYVYFAPVVVLLASTALALLVNIGKKKLRPISCKH